MPRLPWDQRFKGTATIPDDYAVPQWTPNADQPAVIKQSLQVREKRLSIFPADVSVAINSNLLLLPGGQLPVGCTGFRFIKVVGNVQVSINGGGFRTVQDQDVVSGADVQAVQVVTDGTGTCIFQSFGEGA